MMTTSNEPNDIDNEVGKETTYYDAIWGSAVVPEYRVRIEYPDVYAHFPWYKRKLRRLYWYLYNKLGLQRVEPEVDDDDDD
jgi:hypothetical protein